MARYEHLPIYKQALDVAVHFEQVVAGFSRYHKYTLGTELRNQSRAVVAAIVKANAARDKRAPLLVLRERPLTRPDAPESCPADPGLLPERAAAPRALALRAFSA